MSPPTRLVVPTPPPIAISPISRSDTTSAASTIYTVRYHTLNRATPPVSRQVQFQDISEGRQNQPTDQDLNEKDGISTQSEDAALQESNEYRGRWHNINNPFKRRRALAPAEVRQGQVIDPVPIGTANRKQPIHNYHPWDIKGRLGALAAEHGERWRERSSRQETEDDLPVTIIPAQPRGEPAPRPWSPDGLATAGSSHSRTTLVGVALDPNSSSSSQSSHVDGDSNERAVRPTIIVASSRRHSRAPFIPGTTLSTTLEESPRRPGDG